MNHRYDVHRQDEHDDAAHQHEENARLTRLKNLHASERGLPWRRCIATVVLMLIVVTAALGAGLYWRLGKGPLSTPFLTGHAREALAAKLPPGYGVDLGGVSIDREDGGLAVRLDQVVFRDAGGNALVSAPHVVIGLAGARLMFGSVAPRSIAVEGAAGAIVIGADGRLSLRNGTELGMGGAAADMSPAAMLSAFDAILGAAGSIDTVELRDASLAVHDKAFGRDTVYRNIKLAVRRTSAAGGLSLSLAAGSGTVNATIEGREDGARLVELRGRGIAVRDLVIGLAPSANPPDLQASIDVLGRARIDQDGTVTQASATISSQGGRWRLEPKVDPFIFDEAGLSLRWDGANRTVAVEQAMLRAGNGVGVFSGRLLPPSGQGGDWMIELDGPGMTLAGPRPEDPPLQLDRASIRGRYSPAIKRIGIDNAEFSGPTARVVLAGSVTFGDGAPGIGLGLVADRMSVTAFRRLWPFFAVPEPRDWVNKHVTGGTLEGGKLSVAIPIGALTPVNGKIPPLPDDAVEGDFRISGGALTLFNTLPPITAIDASGTFTAGRFDLAVERGRIDTEDKGGLELSNVSYVLPDLDVKPPAQQVSLRIAGPTAAVADLMTRAPLAKATSGVPLDPATVTGTSALEVKLALPLVDKPKDSDIKFSINGALSGVTVTGFEGGKLEDGSLKVAVEPGLLLVTGQGEFGGLPARIDYRKAGNDEPQIAMAFTLDDAIRKKKGLDFGDALNGPVTAEVRPQNGKFAVDVDLASARIRDLLPGWQKPPGRPGKVTFTWSPQGNGGGTVEGLALDSGPVSLRGEVSLGPDNKLRRASFTTLRFSPDDDAQGTFEPTAQGMKATVRGRVLDVRPVLQMLQQRGGGGKGDDLLLDVKLDQAAGFGGETLSALALQLETKGAAVRRIAVAGQLGSGALAVTQRDSGTGTPRIVLDTPDAGALLRFFDYYGKLRGGTMRMSSTSNLNAMSGQISIRDFAVENEPALGQYRSTLQQNPNAPAGAPVPPAAGNSAQFRKLRLGFQRSPERVTIADAVVWGSDVGVSIAGFIDYAADKVSMTGTFVPAYALNNLFGKIPILGQILGGGENGGLFAINFKVSGAVSAPVLTVNPLSAIAPGFLRKLFEFQQEN